jgi:regulator of sigma E protease
MKVEKFAIWMGKPIWSKKIDGVEYILGTIPAGGYVALPQMAPMEALEGKNDTPREELPPASPGQKIIVAFAGPLFSFGLAVFFACIVWVVGKPVSDAEATTTIGYVFADMPAGQAHLQAGDKVLSIDDHKVSRFGGVGNSIMWRIMTSTNPDIPVVVERDGKEMTFNVTPKVESHAFWQRSSPRRIGISPATDRIIVGKVVPDSPATVAGLLPKDQLIALNGQHLYTPQPIYDQLKDHPNDPVKLTILRKGKTQELTLIPEKPIAPAELPKDGPQTDIGIYSWEPGVTLVHPNPIEQVGESAQAVIGTLEALFTPHTTVGASQLSGPIGIMNVLFMVLSSENGWRLALWFAVVINVNLAMLNMFPFPVLDGGHITLAVIEWIRKRPLSMAILEPLQTACALFLISYMLYITFFDAQDSYKLATSSSGDQEIKFAPKQIP